MSRPSKLNSDQKERVSSRLQLRASILESLTQYTLKQIANMEGVSYGIVWRMNAKIIGKRNYKIRNPIAIPDVGTEDKANASTP